jgi:peptide/nickel transport system permease protein
LLAIFLLGVVWKWVPVVEMRGELSPGTRPAFSLGFILDALEHVRVLLPVYVICSVGSLMLQVKSNTVAALGEDYVTAARARSLPDGRVLTAYVGRNAALPLLSQLTISAGFVAGSSVLLESLFAYHGIGFELARAIAERDYPLMQGVLLVITAGVIFADLLADCLYGWIDPRVRVAKGES